MSHSNDEKPKRRKLDSFEVAHWPEFIAFCERAGIAIELPWRSMTIRLAIGEVLSVTQEYLPDGIPSGPKTEGDES